MKALTSRRYQQMKKQTTLTVVIALALATQVCAATGGNMKTGAPMATPPATMTAPKASMSTTMTAQQAAMATTMPAKTMVPPAPVK
jgi:hypothetical protein